MSTPSDQIEPQVAESPPPDPGPQPDYAVDNPPAVVAPEPEPERAEPPEGWDRVDFDLIPEEHRQAFQNRFNRLYYQIKQGQRERSEERTFYQGLESKLDKFINSEETARAQTKIELMSEKAKKLFSDGDHEGGIDQLKKIVRAERELASKPTPEPKTESPSTFTEDEKNYLADFVQKHEWAGIASPHHALTRTTLARFLASGVNLKEAVDATEEIMTELVARNGGGKQQPVRESIAQAVLGQSRGGPPQERGPVLNEYEQAIARRFFPQLAPDKAYARYLRGKKGD